MKNFFCCIYINTDLDIDSLCEEIEKFLSVKADKFHSFNNERFILDVLKNKEFDEIKCNEFPDGFLYFNYRVEVDCQNPDTEIEYIKLISSLIDLFWDLGFKVVTSCDFEDILPNQGGYNKLINY